MLRSGRARLVAGLCAVAAAATAAWAQMRPLGPGAVMDNVARLRPGEYIWAPEIVPEGPILVVVNIATQKLVAYRNGVPFAVSTASTGKPGHRTPLGIFTVLQKRVRHFSSTYNNAPMPFMQRLTWQGIALHGGELPGYPASHGCIRLPHEFAKLLFDETHLGMTVVIVNQPPQLRLGPTAQQVASNLPPAPPAPASWHPERSPYGPVSIVISGADRRMVVLRNGVEIGSAPVAFGGEIDQVQAWALEGQAGAGWQWRKLTLPGAMKGSAPIEGVAMPGVGIEGSDPFREALAGVVGPGTTLVAIPDSFGLNATPAPTAPAISPHQVVAAWRRDARVVMGR